MKAILLSLALSLGLTLLLELGVAALLGIRKKQDFLLVGLVNVLTNPPVVLTLGLVTLLTQASAPWYLVLGLEVSAVAAEGLLYRGRLQQCNWNPFLLSLILNGISYIGGLLLS